MFMVYRLFGERLGGTVKQLREELVLEMAPEGKEGRGAIEVEDFMQPHRQLRARRGAAEGEGSDGHGSSSAGQRLRAFAWKACAWVTRPTADISLRTIDQAGYLVLEEGGRLVDTIEEGKAFFMVRGGAHSTAPQELCAGSHHAV